ncbi:MAG: methyl-accepting chemotaxis protein [Zoogloea sp.]|nr:methyl-accepting chemotaxis protein [Zoogloea sp.]MCA0188732.1 methyl-accepting chemotaxis protein [Pseudomonadota bacterium]
MKLNQPVTQREVSFPSGRYLVSKTDTRGVITYANEAFVDISGFSRAELIGQHHNLVRHPDMPPEAFADLWGTLKSGLPWHGLVKNRCKNGDFYWVKAAVVPIRKDGQVVGYMSVRTEPSREQVRQAEMLYGQIREQRARFPTVRPGLLGRFSFSTRLWAIMGGISLLSAGFAIPALAGLLQADMLPVVGAAALLNSLAAITIGIYFTIKIDRPLTRAVDFFNRVAEGKLTNEVDVTSRDETGLLFCQLAGMQVNLLAMLDDIAMTADTIEARSRDLEQQIAQVSEQSAHQFDDAQSVTAATEQLSVSVREVASNATDTSDAANRVQSLIETGNQRIGQTVSMTRQVVDAMAQSGATVTALSQAIQQIGKVTGVISALASQTNLLALNAAIEAARAGEQGRGFAVVADEVRTLAERTASSTQEITATVDQIQAMSGLAVEAMAAARREVEATITHLQQGAGDLGNVTGAADEVTERSRQISSATVEQTQASEDVARSMERITQRIEDNQEAARCATRAAQELLHTSGRLKALIEGFTIH